MNVAEYFTIPIISSSLVDNFDDWHTISISKYYAIPSHQQQLFFNVISRFSVLPKVSHTSDILVGALRLARSLYISCSYVSKTLDSCFHVRKTELYKPFFRLANRSKYFLSNTSVYCHLYSVTLIKKLTFSIQSNISESKRRTMTI